MVSTYLRKKRKAFKLVSQSQEFLSMPDDLKFLFFGIWLLDERGFDFYEYTPEQVQELGERAVKAYLSTLSLEERLAGLSIEEIEACLEQRKKQN